LYVHSRLKASADLNSADTILSRLDKEQKELEKASALIDKDVNSLGTDIQRLEAKRANLEQLLARVEEDISALRSRVGTAKGQIENLEKDAIPSIGNEINSLKSQISLLRDEMDTEPSMSLTEDEQTLLNQLKVIQTELDSDIEIHTQSLDEISIERQRLLSLLNDNLIKRKLELQTNSVPESLRSQPMPMPISLAAARSEWQITLDENEQSLEETSQNLKNIQSKLSDARLEDEKLRADITSSKAQLEKLKAADADCRRELETAQENEEKLMTKVCRLSIFTALNSTALYELLDKPHV